MSAKKTKLSTKKVNEKLKFITLRVEGMLPLKMGINIEVYACKDMLETYMVGQINDPNNNLRYFNDRHTCDVKLVGFVRKVDIINQAQFPAPSHFNTLIELEYTQRDELKEPYHPRKRKE